MVFVLPQSKVASLRVTVLYLIVTSFVVTLAGGLVDLVGFGVALADGVLGALEGVELGVSVGAGATWEGSTVAEGVAVVEVGVGDATGRVVTSLSGVPAGAGEQPDSTSTATIMKAETGRMTSILFCLLAILV